MRCTYLLLSWSLIIGFLIWFTINVISPYTLKLLRWMNKWMMVAKVVTTFQRWRYEYIGENIVVMTTKHMITISINVYIIYLCNQFQYFYDCFARRIIMTNNENHNTMSSGDNGVKSAVKAIITRIIILTIYNKNN